MTVSPSLTFLSAVDRRGLLTPGDRAPDFMLPDQNRAVDPFYALVTGGPIVLHFHPGSGKPAYTAELDALAAEQAALARHGAQVLAISTGALAANSAFAAARNLPFLLLTDPQGRVHGLYGVPVLDGRRKGPPTDAIVSYLLDPNQRVLKAIQGRGLASHAAQILAALAELPTPAPRTIGRIAPVLLIPQVLDRAYCRHLVEVWHARGNVESGTITGSNQGAVQASRHDVKRRRDHHVKDPVLFREIAEQVFRRVAPEVKKAFDVDLATVEEFKIVRYDAEEGGFFRPHRDNTLAERAQRRFAMTLNLNAEEYEGGDLRFPEYGPDRYRPGTGDACVFSCSLLHEATDVTSGSRFTLLSFLLDGRPDQHRRARGRWMQENARALEAGLAAARGGKRG